MCLQRGTRAIDLSPVCVGFSVIAGDHQLISLGSQVVTVMGMLERHNLHLSVNGMDERPGGGVLVTMLRCKGGGKV